MEKQDLFKFKVFYFFNEKKVASRARDKMPEAGQTVRFKGTLYKNKSVFMGRGFVHVELEEA